MIISKKNVAFILLLLFINLACKDRVAFENVYQQMGTTPPKKDSTTGIITPPTPITTFYQGKFIGSFFVDSDFSVIGKNNASKYYLYITKRNADDVTIEIWSQCVRSPVLTLTGTLNSDSTLTIPTQAANGLTISGYGNIQNKKFIASLQLPTTTLPLLASKIQEKPYAISDVLGIEDFSPKFGQPGSIVTITGNGFGKDISYNKVTFDDQVAEIISANTKTIKVRVPNIKFSSNPKINLVVDNCTKLQTASQFFPTYETWKSISSINAEGRWYTCGFTINDVAYVGLGMNEAKSRLNDFFVYNAASDNWSKIANFPSTGRTGASTFVINGIAYVGLGHDGTESQSDFYKYNPTTKQWTQIADFPTFGREHAASFSFNGKGYVCTGKGVKGGWRKDLWEYDPTTNKWTERAPFIGVGTGRSFAAAFVVNNRIFVGGGVSPDASTMADWYEYFPSKNSWRPISLYFTSEPYAFTINDRAFIVSNTSNRMTIYDATTDTWQEIESPLNSIFSHGTVISTNTTGFMGAGFNNGIFLNYFWKYSAN